MPETTCTVHKLIADVALLHDDRVAMVRYPRSGDYDHQTGWFLADDELAFLEHPQDAAKRILHEQLGVRDLEPRLDHVESFQGNDRSWHLAFHFVADVSEPAAVSPGEGIASLQWFSLSQLPERNAVAHHGWALDVISAITTKRTLDATVLERQRERVSPRD